MNNIRSILVGFGVVLYNVGVSFTQLFRPERCIGTCGSCGLTCVTPVIGLAGIGLIVIAFRKFKGRLRRLKVCFKN